MSLRSFHLFFITLSVLLAAFTAAWAVGQYRVDHAVVDAVWGVGAVALGGGLVMYGGAFQRKTRNL
jgi:steroid 5-alpha reductase family enzyme